MYMRLLFLWTIACIPFSGYAQINATFDYQVYYNPENWEPYLETQLNIDGNSLKLPPISNIEMQGKVAIVYAIEKNKQLVNAAKFDLSTPVFKQSDVKDFYNVQRLTTDTGKQELFISFQDLNGDLTHADTARLSIDVPDISQRKVHLSKLTLIDHIQKQETSGGQTKDLIIPNLLKYYPENYHALKFYAECYFPQLDTGEQKDIVLRYYIHRDGNEYQLLASNKPNRLHASNVLTIVGQLNITAIPSGNYQLKLEVINRDGKIIASQSMPFYRSNPKAMLTVKGNQENLINQSFIGKINSYDTLYDYISCLFPIASNEEKELIEYGFTDSSKVGINKMQLFFYNFWYARNSLNPSESWIKYREDVNRVNNDFGNNFREGYESDRGITYLKYGPPNIVSSRNEPSAYPYEIWFYEQAGGFGSRRFVFYNPSLAGNDFVILHSDMPGEIRNPNWVKEIYRRGEGDSFGSPNAGSGHWGSQAQDLYNNPR